MLYIYKLHNLFFICKDDKTILAADIAEAKITGHDTPSYDPHKKADGENRGWLSGSQTTIRETPVAPFGGGVMGQNEFF